MSENAIFVWETPREEEERRKGRGGKLQVSKQFVYLTQKVASLRGHYQRKVRTIVAAQLGVEGRVTPLSSSKGQAAASDPSSYSTTLDEP